MLASRAVGLNPVHALYRSKARLVTHTRLAVLRHVRRISPRLAAVAESVLEKKLRSALPPLGEMLPWVLGEISDVPAPDLDRLARGWLAIYLYGHLLDERSDRGARLSSEEQLLCWNLFQFGLSNVHSVTAGTRFDGIFEHYLNSAVKYQLHDLADRSKRVSVRRKRYSSGKNHCLVACAAAVAATRNRAHTPVVEFTLRLIPGLQNLDDIADFKEDASQGNYTHLLSKAVGTQPGRLTRYSAVQLIERALISGALEETLSAAGRALKAAKQTFGPRRWRAIDDTPSGLFFDRLLENVTMVRRDVASARREFRSRSIDEVRRRRLLRRVHRELEWVAQGS